MNIETHIIGGIEVEVHHKGIKNLHIGVYPPDGRVRVAAPLSIGLDAIKLAVLAKSGWIRRKVAAFQVQERQTVRQYVSGETYYLWRQALRLEVITWKRQFCRVTLGGNDRLVLAMPEACAVDRRRAALQGWRRAELRKAAEPRIEHWSKFLDVSVAKWGIREMRTMWGSCNPDKRIVWLNSDLVEKPIAALDYVVLHELAHLISARHDGHFRAILDQAMPKWQTIREELNALPLSAWKP